MEKNLIYSKNIYTETDYQIERETDNKVDDDDVGSTFPF